LPELEHIDVSIVVPVMNEAESVPVLAREVTAAFDAAGRSWECLWIDDGSTDDTLDRLRALHGSDPRHEFVAHDRNYGQAAALSTGFSIARGPIIATLDGDLQNDPSDLPRLIEMIEAGMADMVNGVRTGRRDNALRRLSSRVANAFRNRVSGMHRFLPTLVAMRGWRIIEVPVSHRPRVHGQTSYGVHNRLWVGIADTFGVRWLASRSVNPRIGESSVSSESPTGRRPNGSREARRGTDG
jgi:dolichol-phosphate mannosyltransferase